MDNDQAPTPPRVRNPRASLSRAGIIAAALDLVAREGFEALTMRGVANVLGTGAMALYRHFRSREELVAALLDELLGAIPLTLDDGDDWEAQLRRLAHAHHAMLMRNPGAIPYFLATPATGRNAVRFGEVVLGVLHRAGFSEEATVGGFFTLLTLNYGFVSFEARRQPAGTPPEPPAERIRRTQLALALLPADEFPLTVALAAPLARLATTGAQYEFALDVLIAGIARQRLPAAGPQGEQSSVSDDTADDRP